MTLDQYRLFSARALACVAMLLAPAGALVADEPDFDSAHRKALAENPPGVTLTLSADKAARQFRLGEPLPLKLTFTFADSKRYDFDDHNRVPDLSMLFDSFYATPTAGVRRLESRSTEQGDGFLGSATPLVAGQLTRARPVHLDEWLRFQRPGVYRVYCTSRRVSKASTGPRFQKPLYVTSNILEIEILPISAAELAEKLRQADKDFGPGVPKDRRLAAVAWLRRVDSEQAARLLAGVYLGNSYDENAFDDAVARALEQSGHRRLIIQELKGRLRRPDFGPAFPFVETLVELDIRGPALAGTALQLLDAAQLERYAKIDSDHRYRRQRILLAAYIELLWRELPRKNPTARAITAFSLFILRSDRQMPPDGQFNWAAAELRKIIQSDFPLLPARDQHLLLYMYWRRLGGPALAPALAGIIERAPNKPAKPDDDDETPTLLDTVFERLLLADPAAARRLVIAEIRRKRPRVIGQTLLLLPDQPIVELDQLLIERLEHMPEGEYERRRQTAALINRYGSVALLERIQRVVRELAAEGSIVRYPPLLSYWLKNAPKSGVGMVEQALGQREDDLYESLLPRMADCRLAPELLPICIRRLNDSSDGVVESAATVLGMFGALEARQALKDRLRRWHDDLLAADPQAKEKIAVEGFNGPHRPFDSFVLHDLQRSPITVVTPQELRELEPLCLTRQGLDEVKFCLSGWTDPIEISFRPGLEGEFEHPGWPSAGGGDGFALVNDTWHVAHEYPADSQAELKAILARYPRGSTFALPTHVSTDAAEFQKFFDELSTFVEKHGMRLVKDVR